MKDFPTSCVTDTTGKTVTAKENGRVFVARNPQQTLLRKVRIDGCVVSNVDSQEACDYGLWIETRTKLYLIELKGSDIVHGCKQISATIVYLRTNYKEHIDGKHLTGVIVCSSNNVPRLRQNPAYVKLKRVVADIVIKTAKYEILVWPVTAPRRGSPLQPPRTISRKIRPPALCPAEKRDRLFID